MAEVGKSAPSAVDKMRGRLAEFLKANPGSSVAEIDTPQKGLAIKLPWGDESISIQIPNDADALVEALNKVYLPERFTAIWHRDSKFFEIIFTAYPLPRDILERSFKLKHQRRVYQCEYSESSSRLLLIAENYLQESAPTNTSFRNLGSFKGYVLAKKGVEGAPKIPDAKPISFWIKEVDWDDDHVLNLAMHINFYMTYYDNSSPIILVHSPKSENIARQPQTRYRFGSFPKQITTSFLDDNLYHFWAASRTGDPIRRFLYCYQILEYAAYYYLEETVKQSIRMVLAAPNASDNLNNVVQQVLEAVGESKVAEAQKMEGLLRQIIDPRVIWKEIEIDPGFFHAPMTFDGGFVVQPLAKPGWTADDFASAWLPLFPHTLRGIRNALSHGREQRMAAVITPTTRNFERLQRWVPLIAVAAQEVMVYRGTA